MPNGTERARDRARTTSKNKQLTRQVQQDLITLLICTARKTEESKNNISKRVSIRSSIRVSRLPREFVIFRDALARSFLSRFPLAHENLYFPKISIRRLRRFPIAFGCERRSCSVRVLCAHSALAATAHCDRNCRMQQIEHER